jgi:biotin synthase
VSGNGTRGAGETCPRPASEADIRAWAALPDAELIPLARAAADAVHGKEVLLRGLVEVTNECEMDCLYCGIRRSNAKAARYRLSAEDVAATIRAGLDAGFRTFVLQGGESMVLRGDGLLRLTEAARAVAGGDAALTLSFGIRSRREYEELRAAGADRYLMRFETADPELHRYLRAGATLARRLAALEDLRAAGFQLGSGFMTGLPGETGETLIANVALCAELDLDMGGVGPFIPHPDTPLAGASGGSIELALRATALLRLALPRCHIPATTAAGTLHPEGRERMLEAGANVLMPNITPVAAKKNYLLYPGKICLDESGFQCVGCLSLRAAGRGLSLSWARGDAVRLGRAGADASAGGRP